MIAGLLEAAVVVMGIYAVAVAVTWFKRGGAHDTQLWE
jgi:hypothetical protein